MPGWVFTLVVSHLICYGLPDLVWPSRSLVLNQHLALWPYQVLQMNSIIANRHLFAAYMHTPQSAFDRFPRQ